MCFGVASRRWGRGMGWKAIRSGKKDGHDSRGLSQASSSRSSSSSSRSPELRSNSHLHSWLLAAGYCLCSRSVTGPTWSGQRLRSPDPAQCRATRVIWEDCICTEITWGNLRSFCFLQVTPPRARAVVLGIVHCTGTGCSWAWRGWGSGGFKRTGLPWVPGAQWTRHDFW